MTIATPRGPARLLGVAGAAWPTSRSDIGGCAPVP